MDFFSWNTLQYHIFAAVSFVHRCYKQRSHLQVGNLAFSFLKKCLELPRCATHVVLYYPGICCPSLLQMSREAKLSLLSCISISGDPQLLELGLLLHLVNAYLQTQDLDYDILSEAHLQLSSFPMARPHYLLTKRMLSVNGHTRYDDHLDTSSVQCKLKDSVHLETCCGSWNQLMLGYHPSQFSFMLHATSEKLPNTINLQC